jgi:hypothetical protein
VLLLVVVPGTEPLPVVLLPDPLLLVGASTICHPRRQQQQQYNTASTCRQDVSTVGAGAGGSKLAALPHL